jgi:hypothetical protein
LVRATACHAVGHRFESGRPRKKKNRSWAVFLFWAKAGTRTGRGSGKRKFPRGGSIETARFQSAANEMSEQ